MDNRKLAFQKGRRDKTELRVTCYLSDKIPSIVFLNIVCSDWLKAVAKSVDLLNINFIYFS